ncbi:MAG: hypothetical protein D6797_09370 [Bdellovibrio sp.]|nr:MAG: hypothetical protein D6797_09370 [Bdellovibrio sp.]
MRLDFNNRLNKDQFLRWLDQAGKWLFPSLDFIEDPFYYKSSDWKEVKEQFPVRLALDWGYQGQVEGVDVLVLKPSSQDIFKLIKEHPSVKIVVTHLMDHPVGQLRAIAEAQILFQSHPRQFLTHQGLCGIYIYQPLSYFHRMKMNKDVICPPQGVGLGVDDLLEQEPWQRLV